MCTMYVSHFSHSASDTETAKLVIPLALQALVPDSPPRPADGVQNRS